MEKIKYYIRTNKNEIFKTDEGLFNYVIELEQLVEKQKEVIDKAIDCIENKFDYFDGILNGEDGDKFEYVMKIDIDDLLIILKGVSE